MLPIHLEKKQNKTPYRQREKCTINRLRYELVDEITTVLGCLLATNTIDIKKMQHAEDCVNQIKWYSLELHII